MGEDSESIHVDGENIVVPKETVLNQLAQTVVPPTAETPASAPATEIPVAQVPAINKTLDVRRVVNAIGGIIGDAPVLIDQKNNNQKITLRQVVVSIFHRRGKT